MAMLIAILVKIWFNGIGSVVGDGQADRLIEY